MKGYLNCLEVIEEIFKDGWFVIGDIVMVDDEGYFYIVDCKKDMIFVFGFNVFFNEIEEVVVMYDNVVEVVVVGVFYEVSGEVVKLFVVCNDDLLMFEVVIVYCCSYLIGYKVFK